MDDYKLSRRERQIMDVIYSRGEAAAKEVRDGMENPPSPSAVRTFLKILERKGAVKHRKSGTRHIYSPTAVRGNAAKSAMKRVVDVFYGGSLESAVAAHLLDKNEKISEEELERLSDLINKARTRGKEK